MKKTSFLKKLTAMAATLAMTCVMAVGAFAAEPAVDYKLDSAAISVGETWTMSVPAGGMYDWNLSSEYIAYGPSTADKEGVLKQVGYETANGVSTITYEAMMPGTPQPEPMSMGMKDLPDRPNLRNTRSSTKAIRAM